MSAQVNQDFITYAGDDVLPIFTVRNQTGTIIDISTVQNIIWLCRRDLATPVALSKSKLAGGITFVTNGVDGQFQVAIAAADTALLDGYYLHEAQIIDSAGSITTVTVGRMQVGLAPQWTYNPGLVGTRDLYTVRHLVGDVMVGDQQLTDAEVNFAVSSYSNVYLMAAECCRNIAARYARKVDTIQGELRTMYSSQAKKYADMAVTLEARGMSRGAVCAYAGGISRQDKAAVEQDPDRVQPQFNLGMFDNFIPEGEGSGNETLQGTDSENF